VSDLMGLWFNVKIRETQKSILMDIVTGER